MLFGRLAHGDVAGDMEEAPIREHLRAQLDRDGRAVRAAQLALEAERPALPQLGEVERVGGQVVGRDHLVPRATRQRTRRIPEQLLARGVGFDNPATGVEHEDGVGRLLHEGSVPLLAGTEGFLGLGTGGEIDGRHDVAVTELDRPGVDHRLEWAGGGA